MSLTDQEENEHEVDPNAPAENGGGAGDAELEARARRMGWRPLEEYKGDPKRWVDAATFIERGENEMPVLRERLRKQDSELVAVRRDLSTAATKITEMSEVLSEFREFASKGEQRAYERAKREVEAKMSAAVGHADVEGFNEARRELEQLEAEAPKPKTAGEARREQPRTEERKPEHPAEVKPEAKAWVERNPWFLKHPSLNAYAQEVHTDLTKDYPEMSLEENLEEVTRIVKERFPEKFENPRRTGAAPVNTPRGGDRPLKPKGKTYADLPADAKKSCDRFVLQIPGFKREDYVRDYFGSEE